MTPVLLPPDKVLCDADEPLTHVYFIETGLVSLVSVFEDGTTAEMATVGREGLVGIDTLLRSERAPGRYVAPVSGLALAIEAVRFQNALRASPELRAVAENYAQAFLREALQTAACNSVHKVEERCARRLLMSLDRSDDETADTDAGISRRDARRVPLNCDPRCQRPAAGRAHSLPPRHDQGARPRRPGEGFVRVLPRHPQPIRAPAATNLRATAVACRPASPFACGATISLAHASTSPVAGRPTLSVARGPAISVAGLWLGLPISESRRGSL